MKGIGFRHAELDDAPLLARMNQQLIQDEGSRNPMGLEALTLRMSGWLAENYRAILIEIDQQPVGYCLYQIRRDAYMAERQVIYVRQFFVARDWRRQGLGRQAFERIAAVLFPDEAVLELDVLSANVVGQAFWASLGFLPHCLTVQRPASLISEDRCLADDATS